MKMREMARAREITRRQFVQGISCAALVAGISVDEKRERLPIAFSTLGCPRWELGKALSFAEEHGFAAIELRGLEGNLDLPTHPAFAPGQIQQTRRDIGGHGLRIACVSSSASLHETDRAKREKELTDARRFIDLAAALESPYVRVFGKSADAGKPVTPDKDLKTRVAAGLHELGEYAGPRKVTVVIESHDDFTSSGALSDVLREAGTNHAGLLWDAFHTYATSGEEPEETVRQLGAWIRHTHLKDGAGTGRDRKYVLTGKGNVPVRRQIQALRDSGYRGYYCFEWEKVWHPDLEEPEIAIADFARVVNEYWRELDRK